MSFNVDQNDSLTVLLDNKKRLTRSRNILDRRLDLYPKERFTIEQRVIINANIEDIRNKIIKKLLDRNKGIFSGICSSIVHCCTGEYGLYVDDVKFTEEFLEELEGKKIQIILKVLEKEQIE